MICKDTLQRGLLAGVIVAPFLLFTVITSSAKAANRHAVFSALQQQRAIDTYMVDLVEETAHNLVRAAGMWPGFQVNGPYIPGYVMIYLIDSERLPERRNILHSQGIRLPRYAIRGNALCDEASQIIFVDTQLMKEFISYTFMVYNESIDGLEAAARIRATGIDRYRRLWDPRRNLRLASRAYRETWLISIRGMLGFVIGHEMGHIAVGQADLDYDEPVAFSSQQEKDARWACPDLLDPGHRSKQQLERKVDDFCMGLLIRFKIPDNREPQRLLYELGAHSYFSFLMNKALVNALFATSSPNIHRFMRMRLGSDLYNQLTVLDRVGDRGSVQVFYPRYHPATIQRIQQSLGLLTRSPYSAYYRENFGMDLDLRMLDYFRQQECDRLMRKSGGLR